MYLKGLAWTRVICRKMYEFKNETWRWEIKVAEIWKAGFNILTVFYWPLLGLHSFSVRSFLTSSHLRSPPPPPFLSLLCPQLSHSISWLPVRHHAPQSLLEGCQGGMKGTSKRAFDLYLPFIRISIVHPTVSLPFPFFSFIFSVQQSDPIKRFP